MPQVGYQLGGFQQGLEIPRWISLLPHFEWCQGYEYGLAGHPRDGQQCLCSCLRRGGSLGERNLLVSQVILISSKSLLERTPLSAAASLRKTEVRHSMPDVGYEVGVLCMVVCTHLQGQRQWSSAAKEEGDGSSHGHVHSPAEKEKKKQRLSSARWYSISCLGSKGSLRR